MTTPTTPTTSSSTSYHQPQAKYLTLAKGIFRSCVIRTTLSEPEKIALSNAWLSDAAAQLRESEALTQTYNSLKTDLEVRINTSLSFRQETTRKLQSLRIKLHRNLSVEPQCLVDRAYRTALNEIPTKQLTWSELATCREICVKPITRLQKTLTYLISAHIKQTQNMFERGEIFDLDDQASIIIAAIKTNIETTAQRVCKTFKAQIHQKLRNISPTRNLQQKACRTVAPRFKTYHKDSGEKKTRPDRHYSRRRVRFAQASRSPMLPKIAVSKPPPSAPQTTASKPRKKVWFRYGPCHPLYPK